MSVTGDKLREAAARVRAGWGQGLLIDRYGNVCAVGSLGIIHPKHICQQIREHAEELRFLVLAIGRESIGEYDASVSDAIVVQSWNDAQTQTAENVVLTFELAAILADEEELGKQRAAQAAQEGWPV